MGDTIDIICSIVPPPSETFSLTIASVSINGSTAFSLSELNTNNILEGIDLSRYSANIIDLNRSSTLAAIRLVIRSYLPLDSDTTFRCASTLDSDKSVYASTVSGSPMAQVG